MSKLFILGFSRVNATLAVGDEAPRSATISPYNYQDTPKSICKALVAGKGITSVSIVVDGTERFGGVCVGRTVGPDRSAVPGAPAKINLFWVTPQAEPSDPRNTFIGRDGATVNHRTDWVPISRHELLALQAGSKFVLASVAAPKPTPVTELGAIAARVEIEGLTPELVAATVAAVDAGIEEHGLKVTDYTSGKPVDASIAPKGKRAQRAPASA